MIEEKWNIGETFELEEIYVFETHFSKLYPENKTLRASLRRNMQDLRDDGSIEFNNRGSYKRTK